ncbi:hypothetical protein GJ654_02880 [Rhodoblastus acidophilus]|uniref:Uncharacterized protein n=1 Tax=Rhodoblastus acidophilus TaxID=1074 RepID=A0A6N8DMD3_RHOAC|nr:hypothetical protein [Rhodoblastus acidophilus]MCW2273033.1 hypothetical protein [Rhodoblastus acidophilus]MTV29934.1 hypothetical protein [Rhodoblastus acidophilus]
MSGKKILHTSDFDYENVVKRLKQAEQKRERRPEIMPLPMRSAPSRPVAVAQPRPPSFWARATSGLRDESKQMTVAALALLGFGGWLVSSAQALYAQREEALLAGACHENQLAHAGASYCFDDRRIVHTLKADGTAKKPGLDWRVNELSHRMAEAAAARETREARMP